MDSRDGKTTGMAGLQPGYTFPVRPSASYVNRILKGEKPANLPVQ